jgi:hypothetical protein
MGWAGNIWKAADRWVNAELLWEQLCRQVPADRRMEVRYEALVESPEEVLGKICSFLGVPYEARMLAYPADTTYDAPDPALIYQWKKKLSDRDKRLIEGRIGTLLAERSYELSGLDPIRASRLLELRLRAQDRLMRMRFRIKRYGLSLFAADFLLRRLRLRRLHKPVQLRINEIDQQHVR